MAAGARIAPPASRLTEATSTTRAQVNRRALDGTSAYRSSANVVIGRRAKSGCSRCAPRSGEEARNGMRDESRDFPRRTVTDARISAERDSRPFDRD